MLYKVKFELHYPDCDNDIRTCYVVARSFGEAQSKVETRHKKEFEMATVLSIEGLGEDILVI